MQPHMIFAPLFAQVLLTFLVWVTLYRTRIRLMKAKKINPEDLKDKLEGAQMLKEAQNPSNNFINLFEVPVLFYVLTIVLFLLGKTEAIYVYLLSAFVASRYIHSFIQITYNRIMHRFTVYFVGSMILWGTWALLAYQLYL